MGKEKKYILNKDVAEKKLLRMTYEILENNIDEKIIILAGIRESGSVVAKTIQKMLHDISSIQTELISITLDKRHPEDVHLSKVYDFDNRVVIVIDDVVNSGRTLLYAMKPFLQFQPKAIQTLILVERTHKSFPVRPDYVGLSLATTVEEHIYVEVEADTITGAYLQ